MRKTLLLFVALLAMGVGNVNALRLDASFQTPAGNGGWNSGTNTYSWTAGYNNLMTMFSFANGELENYTSLHLSTSDYTESYRVYFHGPNKTIAFYSAGEKNVVFSERSELDGVDLSTVTAISFGGNSNSGSVVLTNVYLEGPDPTTRDVYALGSPITFAEALATSDPFVVVQNGKVLCGPLSSSDGSLTFKDVTEIMDYSWTIGFEEDAEHPGSYYMNLKNAKGVSQGYVNASVWSHTYLSGVNKEGTKGEQQDGALWTVTDLGNGKYSIRNLGVAEGSYNNKPGESDGDRAEKGQGYLAITPSGYWANHVTHYNTSGEWEFYTLNVTQLPINDPVFFGWDGLTINGSEDVTKDDATHFVHDGRGYAAYWAETAWWEFNNNHPFDATGYRYLVFYAKRNVTRYGNGEENTGGSVFIKDVKNNGDDTYTYVTFRGDDYAKYNDVNYPDHEGAMWMNIWNKQRATVIDLQWLANTDKFGDSSECKVLDITKIKAFGFTGDFTIGGAFFTNTLPTIESGDYTREYDEADSFDKFGTVCLPYSAVCCGAQLYEIVGKTATHIILEEVEGVMEAGKPYFYKTLEANQQYWGQIHNENKVYFYKAGYEMVDAPVENNGLIGTFTSTTAPASAGIWVLSKNQLYDTANSSVTVGANKAYIDTSKIVDLGISAKGHIELSFNGATGIQELTAPQAEVREGIFNLNGQRVAAPGKGIYIVNGKKVLFK